MTGGVFTRMGGISQEVLECLSTFDLRIGTLETAFGDGSRLCHKKNTEDLGTIIYSPSESVQMLKRMKIDAVSLANNHSCDCDLEGLYHTIEILDQNGIKHFGAGHNEEEASMPAILDIRGKRIYILGYFREYHYLYRGEGYRPSMTEGGVNVYRIDKVISDVKRYRSECDYLFVMPHWGKEGSVYPKFMEFKDAKKIIDAGADGIIGSHAHIVQPFIKYQGKIIAMNLGNFAFPDRYIVKPRISYYPSDEELESAEIPVVKSFQLVNTLTYKKVSEKERQGMILGVSIRENHIDIKGLFTCLTNDNIVMFRKQIPSSEKFQRFLISCLMSEPTGLLYRIYYKLVK